jgi:MYXO-CTERM domain-containing protein
VHPVQGYEALLAALALGVAALVRRRRSYGGQVFFWTIGAWVAGRALLDPLRHDATPEVFGPLRLAQVAGLGLVVVLAIAAATERARGTRPWEGGPWSPPG